MTYKTTAAYLSGGICGPIWWPVGAMCGTPLQFDLRSYGGFGPEGGCTPPRESFREVLDSVLMRHGGDFQSARFTADTELVIERRRPDGAGRYSVHVRRINVSDIAPDMVHADTYTGDFFGEED
jgi:hypothetical protein